MTREELKKGQSLSGDIDYLKVLIARVEDASTIHLKDKQGGEIYIFNSNNEEYKPMLKVVLDAMKGKLNGLEEEFSSL